MTKKKEKQKEKKIKATQLNLPLSNYYYSDKGSNKIIKADEENK